MDKKDLYEKNILLGIIILGFALLGFFIYDKRPNTLVMIAAISSILIGIIGIKFLKIK